MGPVVGKANKLLDKVRTDGVERRILMLGLDNAGSYFLLYKLYLFNDDYTRLKSTRCSPQTVIFAFTCARK